MSRYPSIQAEMKVGAEMRRKLVYARKRLESRQSHGLIAVNIVDDPITPPGTKSSSMLSLNKYGSPKSVSLPLVKF
jgi:hypothetical protein